MAETDAVAREIEILFRRESGRIVSRLCRVFGPSRLELAEDVVQETMVRALRVWRFQGLPDSPAAWVARTARNLAIDRMRRDRWLRRREPELRAWPLEAPPAPDGAHATYASEVSDDQLVMVYLCCHPRVPRAARVAMTLRAVGGFTAAEIARALLSSPAAVAQGIARAKHAIGRRGIALKLPAAGGLRARTDGVLDALYVMFSQGYHAHRGWDLIRRDVCDEALRLAELVAEHPAAGGPAAHALAALFCFHAARFPVRVGPDGELVLLGDQDRSRYDRRLLQRGVRHLAVSARGDRITTYHVEADIASCHSLAASFESTDWPHILDCYDTLMRINPSPIVAVNRAVALARVKGAEASLAALEPLRSLKALRGYVPFHLAFADSYHLAGDVEAAKRALRLALDLETSAPTRRHVARQLEEM